MEKKTFVTLEQVKEITKTYPTPFHIYDEKGIRQKARDVKKAFAWNKGFREYFAVKATPNPLSAENFAGGRLRRGLLLAYRADAVKSLRFSGQTTSCFLPTSRRKRTSKLAYDLQAYINLDDFTHIAWMEKLTGIPETIFCRYNPGGHFMLDNQIMDQSGRRQIRHDEGADD